MTTLAPSAESITKLHDLHVALNPSAWNISEGDDLLDLVVLNHFYNASLWLEEDQARRTAVPDSEIAKNKRTIDRCNQLRNDMIEKIDEKILEIHKDVDYSNAHIRCETPGAMIDRLSILSLKIHNMSAQLERTDTDDAHIKTCSEKTKILEIQRTHLAQCLNSLLEALSNGTAKFYIYRQFKMYNDPSLNPYLYKAETL